MSEHNHDEEFLEISSINDVPEEMRWELTLALIIKMGESAYNAAQWAVENADTVDRFDTAQVIRTHLETLGEVINSFLERNYS